ncbi:hypothetical protein BDF21DRAFT_423991 [Thamnidium elegans]|nr:hypothetical protein BDF21DRAFT_423991 [Thamnidium elegans]
MIALMIEKLEEDEYGIKTHKVKSFTIEDVTYNINVSEEEMKSCSCPDFVWCHIACKHMYLL